MTGLGFAGLAGVAGAVPLARVQTASIGIPDTLFLMLLALVVFGPRRLPEIGRQIGKLMYEFRKVSNDFKFQMEEELRASEEAERLRKMQAAAAQASAQTSIQTSIQAPAETPALTPASSHAIESAPLELGAGSQETESISEALPAVDGEVRAESPKPPQIAPPSTGEPVAAQRPFRGRFSETGVEAGAQPEHAPNLVDAAGTEEEVRHG